MQYLDALRQFDFSQFNGLKIQTIGEVKLAYKNFTFSGELFNGKLINKFALHLENVEFSGIVEDT